MSDFRQQNRMFHLTSMFLLFVLMLTGVMPVRVIAQSDKDKQKKEQEEKKKQEEEKKRQEKADKQQAKTEKKFKEIKTFALELYGKDPEFKQGVDNDYAGVLRDHANQAYIVNTRDANASLISREDGKLIFESTLYDNPLAQDYINRVGQSLVPNGSGNLYAFRIVQNPVPEARSLATGTVYISTGYLATIDNEAQLAYILGHEIGHIEKKHWFEDVLMQNGIDEWNKKREKQRNTILAGISIGASIFGAAGGGATGAYSALGLASVFAPTILKLARPNVYVAWDTLQEDEADQLGVKYMFDRNYDVAEVKNLYDRMRVVASDARSQAGFISNVERVNERVSLYSSYIQTFRRDGAILGAFNIAADRLIQRANPTPPRIDAGKTLRLTGLRGIGKMIDETLAPEIKAKYDAGQIKATPAEFKGIMALVKRDNGIKAFHFDMFKMSLENLEDSIRLNDADPYAYLFYGKVLRQTAKNPTDIAKALEMMVNVIELDKRQTLAEPYFQRAMMNMAAHNPSLHQSIVDDLKMYVNIYQRENAGGLPSNMSVVYGVMQDLGAYDYRVSPAVNVATKDIDPIQVANARSNVASTPVTSTPVPTPTPQPTPRKKP